MFRAPRRSFDSDRAWGPVIILEPRRHVERWMTVAVGCHPRLDHMELALTWRKEGNPKASTDVLATVATSGYGRAVACISSGRSGAPRMHGPAREDQARYGNEYLDLQARCRPFTQYRLSAWDQVGFAGAARDMRQT